MKKILPVLLLVLLASSLLPFQLSAHAQSAPRIDVNSQYILNRYGYAIVNETVTVINNGTNVIQVPDVGIGLGNLTSHVVSVNVTGAKSWTNSSTGGIFVVSSGESLSVGRNTTFSLTALLNGVVSSAKNGSLEVTFLTAPYVSLKLWTLHSVVRMPSSTQFVDPPHGFATTVSGLNTTYSRTQGNLTSPFASTLVSAIQASTSQDFHPLDVYLAMRQISISSNGNPVVTDTISLKNLGKTALDTITIAPLTSSDSSVTVEPASQPPLLNPLTVTLSENGIPLTNRQVLYPVQAGDNYTIVYRYPLDAKYYTVSGGSVSLQIPLAPPIPTFVDSYTIGLSLPAGAKVSQSGPAGVTLTNESPLKTGSLAMSYNLSIGWALDSGVPAASALFVILLLGLFVSRTAMTEEEETEEESATERASAMIKAFEDKTSLINQLFTEIPNADPSKRGKAYFDGLRSRLDTYRSRALQRLNEVKQKSTTQRFFDLLNQLHTTEREVDRAAKDTLNLYEQYYTNRMRKEVFDRLLPSYRRRLEKALDQLSEELHVAQKEAKLL